ncbi:hypothetical protein [Ottowia sp.]|uniref:hypothetical protein n=1 Tax=Ottowia sp. TaxID=1898956 RepID=UPI0025DE2801|nr:hypothetical protein [Ottowia sp.]
MNQLTPTELSTIRALLELARVTFFAMDDSEEFDGDDGRCHSISGQDFDDIDHALDALEELPDDKPGVTMGPAQKAEWVLRRLLADAEEQAVPVAVAGPDGWKLVPVKPTDKMLHAAYYLDLSYMPGQEHADRAAVYRAMIAAAPEPPAAHVAPESSARALNGAVRAEIVEMLGCMGRKHLVDAAKTDPLRDVIGMVFTELSDADAQAQDAPRLRKRITALRRELAAVADMPKQMEQLNNRLSEANGIIDALRTTAALPPAVSAARAARESVVWTPISTAPKHLQVLLMHNPSGSMANGFWLQEANDGAGAWAWPYIHKDPTHWMSLPART